MSKDNTEHAFDFTVDGESFTTDQHELTPGQILTMAKVDAQQYYLVEIRGHEQIPLRDLNAPIKMHEHMKFITVFNGPTPVAA